MSTPPSAVQTKGGAWFWEQLRDHVLPPLPAFVIALGFLTVTNVGMSVLVHYGWQPIDRYSYVALSVVTTTVLLTRDRFPLLTLLWVVVLYPDIYDLWMSTNLHVLPFVLAGYTVAASGALRMTPALLLTWLGLIKALYGFGLDPADWPVRAMIANPSELWYYNVSRTLTLMAVVAAGVLLGRASYRQKRTTEELRQRYEELERLRQLEADQIVAAERTRIARELHDVVAHHVSAVVLRAQAADRVADARPEELRDAVRWIAHDGQQTLTAMRQVVRVLRSDTAAALAPQSTLAEVPDIASRMEGLGVAVDLRMPAPLPLLPAAVELAAVRIIQESLTNALVHAEASETRVEVRSEDSTLVIEVHDDGGTALRRPKRAPTQSRGSGHGLIGMRERAASCSGSLEVGDSPLGGWLVRARLSMVAPSTLAQELAQAGARV